jgi:hypothetical protein
MAAAGKFFGNGAANAFGRAGDNHSGRGFQRFASLMNIVHNVINADGALFGFGPPSLELP